MAGSTVARRFALVDAADEAVESVRVSLWCGPD